MKKDKLHIHWYPGHIAKAERKLKEQLSLVDAVIEVIDARLPFSSSYDNITRLLGEKPRLILLNKSDLTVKSELKAWIEKLEEMGLTAAVIGRMQEGNTRILINEDEVRHLEPNRVEEYERAKQMMNGKKKIKQ